ncbi:MAG: hypothetical protein Q9163_005576 [Psora crenata]
MYTPTYVPLKYWYYPVGNTPAVNLVRDLPTIEDEEQQTNILSLACGDPRNILFTLWCEKGYVDVCVTVDCKKSPYLTLWNLFYHFYIPEQDLLLLRSHIAKLLHVSDSYKAWTSSSYGEYIKFIDQATLPHLRKYWAQYAATEEEDHVRARNAQARSAIRKRSAEIVSGGIFNGARAAGPLLFNALPAVQDIYRRFWVSGVAGGNAGDIVDLGNRGEGIVNPLFTVSSAPSREFAVHYAAEPLVTFHFAEAFYDKPSRRNVTAQAEKAVAIAKAQFLDWCNIFKCFVQEGKVVVRLFFGDALAFAHALQLWPYETNIQRKNPRSYRKAWSLEPVSMDGQCPKQPFDVIDTSNLGDHVGLINILSATAPLLKQGPAAALYTESLLMATEDTADSLAALLGSDVTTFSLIVGLIPSGLLSGVTMEAAGNEAALSASVPADGRQRQYRMRLTWKHSESDDLTVQPGNGTQVAFESKTLASYLFSVYRKMFVNEDTTRIIERNLRMRKSPFSVDSARYTRAGMVALLRLVRSRISVDWDEFMRAFLDNVESDRTLLVGLNSLQELYMHLHLFGLWTTEVLSKDPRQLDRDIPVGLRPKSADKGLLASDKLPSHVHLVLIVPRDKLQVFTGRNTDEVGTPPLHVSVRQVYGSSQFQNSFSSFQSCFGNVKYDSRRLESLEVKEDENGWLGTEDLIIITAVPTFGLLMGRRDGLRVALRVSASPETAVRYSSLGLLLIVYETGLDDDSRCFVCYDAPNLSTNVCQGLQKEWAQASILANHRPLHSMVELDCHGKATHFHNHVDFSQDSAGAKALASGSTIRIEHTCPSTITMCIGAAVRHIINYPFSVEGSRAKLRIARKSSWVEVEAPIKAFNGVDRFDSWTQMAIRDNGVLMCKDIPRIDLSIQPLIPLSKGIDTTWIPIFLGPTLSDAECATSKATTNSPTSGSVKVDFKRSLNTLFSFYVRTEPNKRLNIGKCCRTFQLSIEGSCHTIIFASALHLDLDLGSIVLEAFALPLTIPKVTALAQSLKNLQEAGNPLSILVTPAESVLWKRLLPALAERCRIYPHKPDCEYRRPGATIPLSIEEAGNPLCSCGEGQILRATSLQMAAVWKEWKTFAKYVTRIAISPIFPVPFVENSMVEFNKLMKTTPSSSSSATAGAGTSASSLPGKEREQASAGAGVVCAHCGKEGGASLKTCGRCGRVKYCGVACQKAAWREHRTDCKKG